MSTLSPTQALALAVAASGYVAVDRRNEESSNYLDTTPRTGGWIQPGSVIDTLLDLGLVIYGSAANIDYPGSWFEITVTDAGREALERVAKEGASTRPLNASRREALRIATDERVNVATIARRHLGFSDSREEHLSAPPFLWLLSRGLVEVAEDSYFRKYLTVTDIGRAAHAREAAR